MKVTSKRFAGVAGIAAASALVLSACSGGGEIGGDTGGDSESGDAGGGTAAEGCEDFEQYGSFPGTTVSLFSSIRDSEADDLQATFDKFTECTGITVQHNGVGEFEQQLVVLQPAVIVALGAVAAGVLLESDEPITRLRGRFYPRGTAVVMPTYHPAYLLRSPSHKKETWIDMQQVQRRYLGSGAGS